MSHAKLNSSHFVSQVWENWSAGKIWLEIKGLDQQAWDSLLNPKAWELVGIPNRLTSRCNLQNRHFSTALHVCSYIVPVKTNQKKLALHGQIEKTLVPSYVSILALSNWRQVITHTQKLWRHGVTNQHKIPTCMYLWSPFGQGFTILQKLALLSVFPRSLATGKNCHVLSVVILGTPATGWLYFARCPR